VRRADDVHAFSSDLLNGKGLLRHRAQSGWDHNEPTDVAGIRVGGRCREEETG
jgi:hypothetical protein